LFNMSLSSLDLAMSASKDTKCVTGFGPRLGLPSTTPAVSASGSVLGAISTPLHVLLVLVTTGLGSSLLSRSLISSWSMGSKSLSHSDSESVFALFGQASRSACHCSSLSGDILSSSGLTHESSSESSCLQSSSSSSLHVSGFSGSQSTPAIQLAG